MKYIPKTFKKRLEEIRKSIIVENISYGEIAELQGLIEYIDKNNVQLLEWAGVKEKLTRNEKVGTRKQDFTGGKCGNWQKIHKLDR